MKPESSVCAGPIARRPTCLVAGLSLWVALLGCNVQVPDVNRFEDNDAAAVDPDIAHTLSDAQDADVSPGDTVGADIDAQQGDGQGPCPGGCDDQNACTDDKCNASGICDHVAAEGASCDDGNACTAGEACAGGKCSGGKAKACDDNNTCTADACLPAIGCTHTDDDGAGCSDNDACTQNDTCLTGKCTGAVMTCGADDCNTAKCLNGNCTAAPKIAGLNCNDGDACTSGTKCNGNGLCAGGAITDCDDKNECTTDSCDSGAGCVHSLATVACSDDDGCTVGDGCSGGTCKPGAAKVCDDGNGCTTDLCNPVDGACGATPTSVPCTDGNACTTGDACVKGACVAGAQVGCDDKNPCTVDSCDASSGVCSHVAGSAACDDGDGCTVGDTCVEGACQGGASKQCADKDTCTSDSCDVKTGDCVHSPIIGCGDLCQTAGDCNAGDVCNTVACLSGKCAFLPTSAPCDDGDACTLADTCQTGGCKAGSAKNCDDGNPCTDDACAKGQCLSNANTAPCNDNNACTLGDLCAKSSCSPGGAKPCDDGNPCTADGCDTQGGSCTGTPNTAPCDDKNPCTQGDACQAGACLAGAAVGCDDGNLCTNDACDPKTGNCVYSNSNAPCSDGDACTQGDGCSGGACISGTAKACDDSNPCTNDSCDAESAVCKNLANAATCTDGDACTIGDGCASGACKAGAGKVCADADTCTNDTCDSASGKCVFKPISGCGGNCVAAVDCKDGNVCTEDSCLAGKCAFPGNTASCDDGSACTVGDVCASGSCKPGSPKTCDDGNPCTSDACTAQTGACAQVANAAGCDDGNACTSGDICATSKCQPGKTIDCSDGNLCTDDACDPTSGGCKSVSNKTTCDDANACTLGDLCSNGACKPGAAKGCDDSNVCTSDGCDVAGGACTHVANTSPCSDANACTLGDVCAASACKAGAAKNCDDGKLCTDDSCDKGTGTCGNAANAVACEDGNKCTLADKCALGACQPGAAAPCDDKDACTNDSCNPGDGSCVYAPKVGCGGNCGKAADCSDGNPCTDDQCTGGKCAFPANTATCDDTNPCTISDVCASGSCKSGTAKPCDDTNPCTNDSCNVYTGACAYVNNTVACSDNNACTLGDACAASKCVAGQAKVCNDGNGCTDDSCSVGTGTCAALNNILACSDGNACTTGDVCNGGLCKGGAAPVCDDGKPCTTDSCDSASGCKTVNNTQVCNDNNACTTGDTCGGGVCVGGAAPNCDDNKLCTNDSCDSTLGCKHADNTVPCTDGNACTLIDTCASGACLPGAAKACNDNDNCTTDSCDPASGSCVYKPIIGCGGNCAAASDCGDSNACTTDSCSGGKCSYANNTSVCNDGSACTTNDACSAGQCAGGAAPNCNDNNVCTTDSCDKAKGCVNTNNTASCNDSNACTTGDLCSGGVCVGGAAPNCNDNNVCTTDACDQTNGCTHANNTSSCDDSDACTAGDVCAQAACAGTVISCDDKKDCTTDSCDKSKGCQALNVANGNKCDDGNACSVGDNCQSGTCQAGKLVWVDKLAGLVPVDNKGYGGGGFADGTYDKAQFNTPQGIAFEPISGALFVADSNNHAIRKVTLAGVVSTFAGNGTSGAADGEGGKATFSQPIGIAADGTGNLYVADYSNSMIRKITASGTVTTVVGSAGGGFVDGKLGSAKLLHPKGIAVSSTGLLAVADSGNHAIRIINLADGTVTTLAGGNGAGFKDGSGANVKFYSPVSLGFDPAGSLWVADMNNHRIRKVAPNGSVITAGGDGTPGFADSLDPTTAKLYYPSGVWVTPGIVVHISDSYNSRIRKGSSNGMTTVAGGGAGPGDGAAGSVGFYLPAGLTMDASGYIYVADSYHHIIRRIRDTSSPCNIKGTCYVGGTWNPTNDCQACASASQTDWTAMPVNAACDDGDPCTANDICSNLGECYGKSDPCNDANLCTDDACDGITAQCTFTSNFVSCNDNNACTVGDSCISGICKAGSGNLCNDNNPCTADTCAAPSGTCAHTDLAFGTACSAASTQAYGFCTTGKCTGLEQSAPLAASGVTSHRLTGVGRGPDGNLQLTGFGYGTSAVSSLVYQVTTTASPPAVTTLLTASANEYWALAYRLVTGGRQTLPTVYDNIASVAGYAANGAWQNSSNLSLGASAVRILRHAVFAKNANGNETYYAGGNADTSTSGAPTTTLYRMQYQPANAAWAASGAGTGFGEMGLFSDYAVAAGGCAGYLMTGHVAGLYAPSDSEVFVAANTSAQTAVVGYWSSNNSMNTTCAPVAPGGSIQAAASNSWSLILPNGVTVSGVGGSGNSHVLAVGYTATPTPVVYRFSGPGTWTAESPSPTPPSGMPAFGSGAYKPTGVAVDAANAWIAGTVVVSGCNYLFALHGTASGTAWTWDKLLVSTTTAYVCNYSNHGELSVTRVWIDPTDGAVYITGSAAKDSAGGTKVGGGTSSQGQVGVLWRIKQ